MNPIESIPCVTTRGEPIEYRRTGNRIEYRQLNRADKSPLHDWFTLAGVTDHLRLSASERRVVRLLRGAK